MQKYLFSLFWLLLSGSITLAQDSHFSVKFFGLSYHPYGDENAHLMPLNPDGEGYVVLKVGGTLGYETRLARSKYAVKVLQSIYSDCAAQLGGFSHFGLRAVIFTRKQHQLSGGLGPTLIFRRNWHQLPGYEPSSFFKGNADAPWQYRMLWYGGELEYHYAINRRLAFSTTLVPGFPYIINLSAGLRFR